MPRFVILRHEPAEHVGRQSHWDLMLQSGSRLLTWALPQLPGPQSQDAAQLDEHRLDYLEYEGPISGNRGTVWRYAAGTFQFLVRNDDRIDALLQSDRLSGVLRLQRHSDYRWSVVFEGEPGGED